MTPLTETLSNWILGIQALYFASSQVNTDTKDLTLNEFAGTTVEDLLIDGPRVTNFIADANSRFAKNGPKNWKMAAPISTDISFADLINLELWQPLDYSVRLFVQSFCPAECTNSNGDLDVGLGLLKAFPEKTKDSNWKQLQNAIGNVNLDAVIAAGTLTAVEARLNSDQPGTLDELIKSLSTL